MGARYGAGISPMKSRSVEDKGTPVNGDRNGVLEPAGPLGTWSHRGNQVTVRWLQVLHGIKSPSDGFRYFTESSHRQGTQAALLQLHPSLYPGQRPSAAS
ncbi:hypothetical protein PMIN02_006146 [Paraphaeosphaeria minitans]